VHEVDAEEEEEKEEEEEEEEQKRRTRWTLSATARRGLVAEAGEHVSVLMK
jgi:hypothetical protein